jgi:hypothetical protein
MEKKIVMEELLKCKVVMLTTNKNNTIGSIVKRSSDNKLAIINVLTQNDPQECVSQHLYLISNRAIQVYDWCIDKFNQLGQFKFITKKENPMLLNDSFGFVFGNKTCFTDNIEAHKLKKVEATTDPSLNLPLIDQSFIEDYVKVNGKIDKVYIEMEIIKIRNDIQMTSSSNGTNLYDKIEVIKARVNNTVFIHKVKTYSEDEKFKDIIEFAKWYSGMDQSKIVKAYNRWIVERNDK